MEIKMSRMIRVVMLPVLAIFTSFGADAQQGSRFIEAENAAAGDVQYRVTATTAKIPYANIEDSVSITLTLFGSKPGSSPIVRQIQGGLNNGWGATKSFDIYNENIGYVCRIALATDSQDGWNPASIEVDYFYLNEPQNRATFSNKGAGIGWIDNKGCGQNLATVAPNFNLARGGVAEQISVTHGGVAALAIDGNTDGASVTHTGNTPGAWWQVTLRQPAEIGMIKLWNRTACCSERLSNFKVSVLDTAGRVTWSANYWENSAVGPDTSATGQFKEGFGVYPPEGIVGNKVRVELLQTGSVGGDNILSLAEVEVFGNFVAPNYSPEACKMPPRYFADTLEEACKPNSPQRNASVTPTATANVSVRTIENNDAQLASFQVGGSVHNGNGQRGQVSLSFQVRGMNGQYQDLPVNESFSARGQATRNSEVFPITSNSQTLNVNLAVPYGAFQGLTQSNQPYSLRVWATMRVGNAEVKSQVSDFQISVW